MRPRHLVLVLVLAMTAALGITLAGPVSSSPSSTADAAVRESVSTDYSLLRRAPRS